LARRLGATTDQIEALGRGDLSSFDDSWAAALRVAETMTSDRGHISAAHYAALENHWNTGQIIEIIAVVSLFNYFNRFAIGLDIPPTR
jgi:alkylhydroperoxidase family enzyme